MKKKKEIKTKEKKSDKPNKIAILIFYAVLLIIDSSIIIYFAKHNYVNYVSLLGQDKVLISKTQYLFFGRNYTSIIISVFFSIYTLLCNKYLLKINNNKKITIGLIIFYFILNITLFYLFTKKIY